MTGADFLLPIAAGAAISWASYSVVAHVVSKQHISTLRATVWGALGTLSLVLGVCAFSALGAEHQTAQKISYVQMTTRNAMRKRTITRSGSAGR